LIIACLKGSRSIDLKEVAVIVMSFYAGFAMFDLALEILKNFVDSAMFPEVIFSVVGGGLVQLYT
jgi:hypothetical protein